MCWSGRSPNHDIYDSLPTLPPSPAAGQPIPSKETGPPAIRGDPQPLDPHLPDLPPSLVDIASASAYNACSLTGASCASKQGTHISMFLPRAGFVRTLS